MIRNHVIGLFRVGAVALFVFALIGIAATDDIAIPTPFPGRYIDIEGETIRFHQAGAGRDVLLVHGLPGSIEEWEPVFGLLATRYRVTAFDRPGQGFSSARSDDFSIQRNATLALGLITRLSLRNVIAVGHSYGGGVILALAVQDPPEIAAYLSIAGSSRPRGGAMAFSRIAALPVIGRGIAACGARVRAGEMVAEGIRYAFHPNDSSLPADYIETRLRIWLQTKVLVSMAKEDVAYDAGMGKLTPLYSKIRKPLVILHGDRDRNVPVADSVRLYEAVPSSRLIILRNTGHMVQYANPTAVVTAVDSMAKR